MRACQFYGAGTSRVRLPQPAKPSSGTLTARGRWALRRCSIHSMQIHQILMELAMRNCIRFTVLGTALIAGASLASAQSVIANQPVETMIAQQPGSMLIAQEPVAVPPPGVVVMQPAPATVPLQTVETVRTTVQTTTVRRRNVAGRPLRTVTTTRTTVRERVVPAPMVAAAPVAPPVRAIAQPEYTEVVAAPGVRIDSSGTAIRRRTGRRRRSTGVPGPNRSVCAAGSWRRYRYVSPPIPLHL